MAYPGPVPRLNRRSQGGEPSCGFDHHASNPCGRFVATQYEAGVCELNRSDTPYPIRRHGSILRHASTHGMKIIDCQVMQYTFCLSNIMHWKGTLWCELRGPNANMTIWCGLRVYFHPYVLLRGGMVALCFNMAHEMANLILDSLLG